MQEIVIQVTNVDKIKKKVYKLRNPTQKIFY